MALRKVKYLNCTTVKDSDQDFTFLAIRFENTEGKIYNWFPKWADLLSIIVEANTVETQNQVMVEKKVKRSEAI